MKFTTAYDQLTDWLDNHMDLNNTIQEEVERAWENAFIQGRQFQIALEVEKSILKGIEND